MRSASFLVLGPALAAAVLAVACGSSTATNNATDAGPVADSSTAADTGTGPETGGDGGSDAKAEADASNYPAFKPTDVPQVANAGGPVMATPKIVPIFYAADDAATVTSLKDFLDKLHGSTYWAGWDKEYNVGDITIDTPITLTDTLPSTWDDTQIQADLAARLASATSGFPAPDANTIYAYFFPPNVTITAGGGAPPGDGGVAEGGAGDAGAGAVQASCTSFGGYHDNIVYGSSSMPVAYAVIPRCPSFGPLMGLDAITGPATHELAEAATDPFPTSNPAFVTVDTTHSYWSRLLGGGEVGDMCAQEDSSFVKTLPGMPYTVQRIWSNAAAMAGTDPCLPLPPNNVYFNTIPVMPDMLTIVGRTGTTHPQGVEIPVGASKTIELDLFSTEPTGGPWTVKIIDASGSAGTYLSAAFMECQGQATCTGQNGDKLHVTLGVKTAGRRNYEPFLIESKLPSGQYQLWAGVVGTSADGG